MCVGVCTHVRVGHVGVCAGRVSVGSTYVCECVLGLCVWMSVLGMCVRVGRVCWACICVRVCVGYMHMSMCVFGVCARMCVLGECVLGVTERQSESATTGVRPGMRVWLKHLVSADGQPWAAPLALRGRTGKEWVGGGPRASSGKGSVSRYRV